MNPRILDRANIMEEMVESELEMDVDVVLKWESWNWGPWRLCCPGRTVEGEIVLKGDWRRKSEV